jgi:hypothetical protein
MMSAVITMSLLAAPAHAVPPPTAQPVKAPRPSGIPRYADARVAGRSTQPRAVTALTNLDFHRTRDAGPRRQADFVTAQVIVAPRAGSMISGPVARVDLDGPDRLRSGTHVSVERASGRVRARIPLTFAQRKDLARQRERGVSPKQTAASIRVVFRHHRDTSPARGIHEDLVSVGARARNGGHRLRLPAGRTTLSSSSAGIVRLANTTSNPLVTMAGPSSCMYDSVYNYGTYSGDHGSHLGTMNGVILQPGQSIASYVLNDTSDLDGLEDNGQGTPVLADYNDFLNDAYAQAAKRNAPNLPELLIPAGDDESPWLDMDLSIGFFAREVVKEIVDEGGLWETFASAAGDEAGLEEAELEAFAPFLETVATGTELFEEPFVELVAELITLFERSCDTHDGYIMIGATDQNHPWRQFAQVYDWGHAKPAVPPPGSQGFTSLSNGLVGNQATRFPLWVAPDSPIESSEPTWVDNSSPQISSWSFTESDTPVDDPAIVSWQPGSRDVTCRPNDPSRLDPPAGTPSTYDSLPPYQVLRHLDGSPADATNTYAVGLHYITGASTASVHYSRDGQTWQDLDIPAGDDTVTLPDDGNAVLVKCDVQVAEVFSKATVSGRTAIMGTRIPSDIIVGPDYVPSPPPGPAPADPGSYVRYPGPNGASSNLIPTLDGVSWVDAKGTGFRDQYSGAIQRYPRVRGQVRTADGLLWGTTAENQTSVTITRFDPVSNVSQPYTVPTTDYARGLMVGPDGALWVMWSGHLGRFDPRTTTFTSYPIATQNPGSLVTGPDGNLWVTSSGAYEIVTTSGQSRGLQASPQGLNGYWALGPANPWPNGLSAYALGTTKSAGIQVTSFIPGAWEQWSVPNLWQTYAGVVDAQGNLWFRGLTGSQSNDAVITRMAPDTTFTQFSLPYRPDTGMTVGTDGRLYVAGDATWDPTLMAISTGKGPATTPPAVGAIFTGATASCTPATWYRSASSAQRYWINAATGETIAQGDTYRPPSSMLGHLVQCVEVATLPWIQTPLTSFSDPVTVRGGFAVSGELLEQSPATPLVLPRRITANATTTIVSRPIMTKAGQKARVTVQAYRTGTARPARSRDWTLVRRAGAVKVRVHSRHNLTFEVRVKAPRTTKYAPLVMGRVYAVEVGNSKR